MDCFSAVVLVIVSPLVIILNKVEGENMESCHKVLPSCQINKNQKPQQREAVLSIVCLGFDKLIFV